MLEVNLNNLCNYYSKPPRFNFGKEERFAILYKRHNLVYGTGYQCKKEKFLVDTSTSFFNRRSRTETTQVMKLSRDECLNMVKTKKCETDPMTCEGHSCTGSLIPNDKA